MVAKSLGRALALMLVFPPAALALGLGDLRLRSTLNSPLDAEIELIGATPEELATVEARIASRETFQRYKLDWPVVLSGVTVSTDRTVDGRNVIRLRSRDPITDPFLTLLVEVNWNRGRLVREYTLLLDPPVYTPGQPEEQAPVAAPVVDTGAREGSIARPAEEPAAVSAEPAPEPTDAADLPEPAVAGAGERTRVVQRGDTLSQIAAEVAGDPAEARQWMLAIYRANPDAFAGNMNVLHAGAVLRIPDASAVDAVSPAEATAEIRRQYAAWREATAATERVAQSEGGELRLVTPSEPGSSGTATGASADVQALQNRVRELEAQLNESRRLLELRTAELARLQAQLSDSQQPAEPVQAEPPSDELIPEEGAPAAATPPAEGEEAAQLAEAAPEEPAAEEQVAQAETVQEAAGEPVARTEPIQQPEARAPEPTGSIFDTLKSFWWIGALLAVAVGGLFGVRAWRSRRRAEFDDSLSRLAAAGAESISSGYMGATGQTQPIRPASAASSEEAFLVEESGAHEPPRFAGGEASPAATAKHVTADETLSSETAINLDQGDPLAEADFHMAYGLYDQAADLVRIAIAREPERRDLKLKLLEVFFVWGNKDQFLQTARELAESRDKAAPGEWEKIVIMGKQLAPEDPLFADGSAVSGVVAGGVDLDLEGGQNRVDFDLAGPSLGDSTGAGIDLDLGSALGDKDATTESPTARGLDASLALHETDTTLDTGLETGSTREMTARIAPDAVSAVSDFALDGHFALDGPDAPTVEQPALSSPDNPTIRQKVEMALRQSGNNAEQTAELALDDLGLDLGGLDTIDQPGPGLSSDAPTMVAGLDERSRRIMEEAEQRASARSDAPSETGSWNVELDDLSPTMPPNTVQALGSAGEADAGVDGGETSRLAAMSSASEVDFDLGFGDQQAAGNGAAHGTQELDLDVGTATVPDAAFVATQKLSSEDLALPDLEPVTMSEVGTKLDLARAYMDMGDPEGARNILEEVLNEGSVAQKQEAQRLLASLPG